MSMDILKKPIVLSLNRVWQVIGHRTVEQAIVAMNGGRDGVAPAVALDIAYAKNDDGTWNFDNAIYMNPCKWEEWVTLPVREFDFAIHSAKLTIRVPTVVINANFSQMPMHHPRVSRQAIFERDGGICQYTGEYVGRNNGNLDHIVSRDKGGKDDWMNLVWAKKSVNSAKSNKTLAESGLKLIRPPKAPKPIPASAKIRTVHHPDHRHFILS